MNYDTSETGWRTILRDYCADLLEKFISEWGSPEPFEMISREAFDYENELLKPYGRTISRASVINGLNDMVGMGLLTYRETTGKGGYHRIYRLAKPPQELEIYVVTNILQRVKDTWPEVYLEVVDVVQ